LTCDDICMRGLNLREPDDGHRCRETTASTGRRCKKWVVAGGVCARHMPRDGAVADERKALEVAEKLDVDVAEFGGDVFSALRAKVGRLHAKVEYFDGRVGELASGSLRYRSKSGSEQIRGEWKMLMDAESELRATFDLILRAGVAERLMLVRERDTGTQEELSRTVSRLIDGTVAALDGALADVLLDDPELAGRVRSATIRRLRLLAGQ
jgi:hypothetical protein